MRVPMLDPGECYVDEGPKNWELFYQHTGRYQFAREHVRGKVVLDAACGTGYGAAILAEAAHLVVGLDHSPEALFRCRHRYQRSNVHFLRGDCCHVGLRDGAVDAVISFETLEHLEDMRSFLREIKRVLKPGGILLISTPNRPLYAVYNKGRRNVYHSLELDEGEFTRLLSGFFAIEAVWGQRHFSKKDLPLVREFAEQEVPIGPDGLFRRAVRVMLRTCLPEGIRSKNWLAVQIWAHKCSVGEVVPSHGVYMIAKAKKPF